MACPRSLLQSLVFDAPKLRVHVRVMRLEPVAERPAQHASGCARRTTLHHEVLAIEEIRGISGIERKGLEPWKRRELRARPFPTIPHEIGDAEFTDAVRVRSRGNRIPALEIEIAVPRGWCFRTPGVRVFDAAASAARGAMPFRFARQFFSYPASIGRRLIMADVHRPVERQGNFRKHCAIAPGISLGNPKRGIAMLLGSNPFPAGIGPEAAAFIAS